MSRKTKFLSAMLCIVMVLSLCACGGGGSTVSEEEAGGLLGFEDETDSGVGSAESGSETTENTSVGEVSGTKVESKLEMSGNDPFANVPKRLKGTTVVFAHWGDEGATEYQKVAKAFEKKTGIKVQWKTFNEGEYVAQIAKQITGGAAPDIIICNGTFPAILEIAQPLQNIIDLKDDFWDDEIVKIGTVGGNSYLVNSLNGVWENNHLVFYNKQIFSANGITSPTEYYSQGKWTYENFKKCLEEVVKTGNMGGYADPQFINTGLGVTSIGYDPATQKFFSNVSKMAPGYQFTAQINKEGLWSTTAWWGTFAAGNIGLYTSTVYGAKYNGFFKDANDSILAAVPMPASYQGKEVKPSAGLRGYAIAKGSKNPEGAAYFLRYYLDYEGYYDDAGAEIFKNKSLEKTSMVDVVNDIKKRGRNFIFDGAYYVSGTYEKGVFTGVDRADPAQVANLISAQANTVDGIIKKANEKIAQYK